MKKTTNSEKSQQEHSDTPSGPPTCPTLSLCPAGYPANQSLVRYPALPYPNFPNATSVPAPVMPFHPPAGPPPMHQGWSHPTIDHSHPMMQYSYNPMWGPMNPSPFTATYPQPWWTACPQNTPYPSYFAGTNPYTYADYGLYQSQKTSTSVTEVDCKAKVCQKLRGTVRKRAKQIVLSSSSSEEEEEEGGQEEVSPNLNLSEGDPDEEEEEEKQEEPEEIRLEGRGGKKRRMVRIKTVLAPKQVKIRHGK